MMYGKCRFNDKCKFGHPGKGGAAKQTAPKQAPKEQPMNIEQHAAIVRYAEANGKDASEVTWDTVEKNGGLAKWRVQIEKPGPNPKAFPVLQQRRKKS